MPENTSQKLHLDPTHVLGAPTWHYKECADLQKTSPTSLQAPTNTSPLQVRSDRAMKCTLTALSVEGRKQDVDPEAVNSRLDSTISALVMYTPLPSGASIHLSCTVLAHRNARSFAIFGGFHLASKLPLTITLVPVNVGTSRS